MKAPFSRTILVFVLMLMLGACTTLNRTTPAPPAGDASPAAKALLTRLESSNSDLVTFKATGRIRLENSDGIQHARAMWAGYRDEKMRLEIMGPSGRSVASFAYDGDRIYLISHVDNRFYTKRSSGGGLEKLIHVPLRIDESLDLLAGRIPSRTDVSAELLDDAPGGVQILIAKRNQKEQPYDRIYFDSRSDTLQRVEAYDENGDLRFRAEFKDMNRKGGFQVPARLSVSDGDDNRLDLTVDRFWSNPSVSDALFVLTKPK